MVIVENNPNFDTLLFLFKGPCKPWIIIQQIVKL
jgi:hypothetical protein